MKTMTKKDFEDLERFLQSQDRALRNCKLAGLKLKQQPIEYGYEG